MEENNSSCSSTGVGGAEGPVPFPVPRNRTNPDRIPRAPSPPPDYLSLSISTPEETKRAKAFHELHRLAYAATVTAQNLDASGSNEQAFKGYERALLLIDETVSLAHKGGFSSTDVDRVEELNLKIRMTRKEILERISDLQGSGVVEREEYLQGPTQQGPATRPLDLPPAYSEMAPSPSSSSLQSPYNNLASVLDEIANEAGAGTNPLPINAQEIFCIPENVQIYFISAQDNVSAPSYPSFLRLVLMGQTGGPLGVLTSSVPAFLQVGDWTYPLIPSHSPVFRSTEGIYMFPDLTATVPGSYVGLLLPDHIPPEVRRAFEEALLQLLGIQRFPDQVLQPPPESPTTKKSAPVIPPRPEVLTTPEEEGPSIPTERRLSTKIAEGLITGAESLSRGLLFGATKTSNFLDRGTAFIQSRMEPAKEKTVIKPEYKKGMKTAKSVTGKAVQISGYVVTQVGRATLSLGRTLAPHVHKASTRLLAKTMAHDETDASIKVDQIWEVGAGAVSGFGTVYMGLENAAKVLANSISNNTVQIVQYRYGEEAGEFATDTAATAGNAAMTTMNAKSLAPKSMAKNMVKTTGKVVLTHKGDKKSPSDGGGGGGPPGPRPPQPPLI